MADFPLTVTQPGETIGSALSVATTNSITFTGDGSRQSSLVTLVGDQDWLYSTQSDFSKSIRIQAGQPCLVYVTNTRIIYVRRVTVDGTISAIVSR
jgi:hypothetical protein